MVKYLAIYQLIKERILANEYSTDQKLPDGKSLANEFDCSELTIKKALDILVNEGFVVRKRGSGSYVKRPSHSLANHHLNGTKSRNESAGRKITTTVINFNAVQADEDISQKLRCPIGALVYNITRVRNINGTPSIIEYTYMPTSIISGLSLKHVEDSIYKYIQDNLKLKIHSADMNITISEADQNERKYLNLPKGEKLATVEQVAFLDNGVLFEYSVAKHLWNTFEFSTTYVRI